MATSQSGSAALARRTATAAARCSRRAAICSAWSNSGTEAADMRRQPCGCRSTDVAVRLGPGPLCRQHLAATAVSAMGVLTANAGWHTMATTGPTEMVRPTMAPPHMRFTKLSAPASRDATPRRASNSCGEGIGWCGAGPPFCSGATLCRSSDLEPLLLMLAGVPPDA